MKLRWSNLELFRIVAMMGIVAYHAAWYSGLASRAYADPWNLSNAIILILGAWGKTGINCFILITGYFMCQRKLTMGRFLKVIGLTEFYAYFVLGLLCFLGWQEFTLVNIGKASTLPFNVVSDSFVPTYVVLLVLVPALNWLIGRMSERLHLILTVVLLFAFSVLPSVGIRIYLARISWFVTLYFVAALVRRREVKKAFCEDSNCRVWCILLGAVVFAAIASMAVGAWLNPRMPGRNMIYYWLFPDVKILAFAVAFCAFMSFKNLQLGSSRIINAIGGTTFGVYLLHDGAMGALRDRFWTMVIDCQNFGGGQILIKYFLSVVGVFSICAMVDIVRKQMVSIFQKCGALRMTCPSVKGENV